MKYKIGIYGSAADVKEIIIKKAKELGKALGDYKDQIIIISGATTGFPMTVSLEAVKRGVAHWGFSSAINKKQHLEITTGDNIKQYQKLFFVPRNFELVKNQMACKKYRNITSTASCDAGIIISGRWGTMNEFTNLHDMGKVIGVLTGTGGVADQLQNLTQKIVKKTKATVIFDNSPDKLIKKILKELDKRSN